MEQRVGELEKAVVRIDGRLDGVNVRLDAVLDKLNGIQDSVKNFKWQVLAAAIAIMLAAFGMLFTVQQMTVSTFQAAGQSQQAPAPAQPPTIIVVPSGSVAQDASAPAQGKR